MSLSHVHRISPNFFIRYPTGTPTYLIGYWFNFCLDCGDIIERWSTIRHVTLLRQYRAEQDIIEKQLKAGKQNG